MVANKERITMNKTFYVLLCMISYHAFAGDFSNDEESGAQLEEEELEGDNPPVGSNLGIQLDEYVEGEDPYAAPPPNHPRYSLQQPANTRPGSALDLSYELTHLCYGKPCKANKFCLNPFEKHFKKLNQTDRQQYLHITELVQTKKTERISSTEQHRGMSNLTPTNAIPIELMQFALKALKEESKLQAGTILEHERTSEGKDLTISELKTWGSRKNWGLLGTIGSCAFLVLGYFGYTISPC